MHNLTLVQQGYEAARQAGELAFEQALQAALDYRGDVTLVLAGGEEIVGYIFSIDPTWLDLYPKDSPSKQRLRLSEVEKIIFTGRDTAA